MAEQINMMEVLARKAAVDLLLDRTAKELRDVLKQAAEQLDPFPYFLDTSVQGVEAEPGAMVRPDIGCVLVCPDGELYELTMRIEVQEAITSDIERRDDLQPLNLPPRDYIPYAYNALLELTNLLLEQAQKRG